MQRAKVLATLYLQSAPAAASGCSACPRSVLSQTLAHEVLTPTVSPSSILIFWEHPHEHTQGCVSMVTLNPSQVGRGDEPA